MAKRKLKVNPVLGTDESGKPTIFTIPYEALFFETHAVSRNEEVRVVEKAQKIITEAEALEHIVDTPLLHDDDDKMDLVKRLRKTGQWLR